MAKRKAEETDDTENKQHKPAEIAITETTFEFLNDLEKNNDKGWMTLNKQTYNEVKENFIKFTQYQLTDLQISDSSLSMLDAKDCIFRINRDVRFSTVKAPYKNHFACAFAQGGKKSGKASYYLHIEPNGKSMVGAGMYLPPPAILDKIRKAIANNSELLKESLVTEGFKTSFKVENGLDLLLQTDDKLKTVPKGYPKDHADIELLRLKSFAVGRTFSDEEVLKPEFKDTVAKIFQSVIPFVQVLNSYLELNESLTPAFFVGKATFPPLLPELAVCAGPMSELVLVGEFEVEVTVAFALVVVATDDILELGGTHTPLTQMNPTIQSVLQIGLPTVLLADPVAAKIPFSNRI